MPSQPAWFHRLDEKWLPPAGRRTGVGLRHLPLAFVGPGWFRHKARARTVLSPGGVCHSPLLLSAMPVTGFGSAVPPATGFVRLRHSRLSGNAHKTLTSQEGIMANQKPVAEVQI